MGTAGLRGALEVSSRLDGDSTSTDESDAGLRPKLRHDSVFLQTDEGVFLRNDETAFAMKGRSVYRLLAALTPLLTGDHTVEQLCGNVDAAKGDMIRNLVQVLLDRGFVQDHRPEPAGLLEPPVRAHFERQLHLIDHYADDPARRFSRFREARVLLTGSGEVLAAAGASLLRNGLRCLSVAAVHGVEDVFAVLDAEARALDRAGATAAVKHVASRDDVSAGGIVNHDVVVHCQDDGAIDEVLDQLQRSYTSGQTFLPAVVFRGQAIIGPLVEVGESGCWVCLQLRLGGSREPACDADFWRRASLGVQSLDGEGVPTMVARNLGNAVAFELFKLLTGALAPETRQGVIVQDILTLTSARHRLVAHPLCPVCSQTPELAPAKPTWRYEAVSGIDITAEAVVDRITPLVGSAVGSFAGFTDEELPQIPLKTARLRLAASGVAPGVDVVVHSLDNLLDARAGAVLSAASEYSQRLADPRPMSVASYADLAAEGRRVFDAPELSTWSGGPMFRRGAPIRWLPAYSPIDDGIAVVPAAAVYPRSQLNQAGVFERTSAGSVAASSMAQAWEAGLVSAISYEVFRDMARGRAAVCPMHIEGGVTANPDLVFLAKSVRHLGYEPEVSLLTNGSPVRVALATTRDPRRRPIEVGVGLSVDDAVRTALLALAGALQLEACGQPRPHLYGDLSVDPALLHLCERRVAVTADTRATTLQEIETFLGRQDRLALVVDTTPADLRQTAAVLTGRVLVTLPRSVDLARREFSGNASDATKGGDVHARQTRR